MKIQAQSATMKQRRGREVQASRDRRGAPGRQIICFPGALFCCAEKKAARGRLFIREEIRTKQKAPAEPGLSAL